jgi:hypothetical protein
VTARYDKLAVRFEATVHIAAISEWLLPNFLHAPGPDALKGVSGGFRRRARRPAAGQGYLSADESRDPRR